MLINIPVILLSASMLFLPGNGRTVMDTAINDMNIIVQTQTEQFDMELLRKKIAIEKNIAETDKRVAWLHKNVWGIENTYDLTCVASENKEEYFHGDRLVFRSIYIDPDTEEFTAYECYYNESGALIYADIIHYRAARYKIYFEDGEVLYMDIGTFTSGNLEEIKAVIDKDPSHLFILEDIEVCLKYAYQ